MATVALSGEWVARKVHKTTWSSLASGDVGAAQSAANLPDKTVYVDGTFDTGAVTIQGSNNTATGPWTPLVDPQGNSLTLNSGTAFIENILENPQFIRPTATGGAGSMSVTVYMVESGK